MSLSAIYDRVWGDSEVTKLSEEDQEAYGRLVARGFLEKLSSLSTPEKIEEVEKDASKAKKVTKSVGLAKRIAKAGLVGAAGGGAVYAGKEMGERGQKKKDVRAFKSYLQYLRARRTI